jgi:hypothetical protein
MKTDGWTVGGLMWLMMAFVGIRVVMMWGNDDFLFGLMLLGNGGGVRYCFKQVYRSFFTATMSCALWFLS